MFFWNKFCGLIILFLFLTVFSYAQYSITLIPAQKKVSLKNNYLFFNTNIPGKSKNSFLTFYQPKSSFLSKPENLVASAENPGAPNSPIPQNFATCDYGFFCRQELKIEKATNIPLRFRLGSLEQCNYYEGKH